MWCFKKKEVKSKKVFQEEVVGKKLFCLDIVPSVLLRNSITESLGKEKKKKRKKFCFVFNLRKKYSHWSGISFFHQPDVIARDGQSQRNPIAAQKKYRRSTIEKCIQEFKSEVNVSKRYFDSLIISLIILILCFE